MKYSDVLAVGNDHIHIRTGGNLRRDHFGIHAAGPHITAGTGLAHMHEFLREFIHLFDKFRIGILPGIIGLEAIDI